MDEATDTDSDAQFRRRKSSRPRKRTTAYSPEPKSDEVKKRKNFGKTQPNRPYDILPNGEPFSCTLCKGGYVGTRKGSEKQVKSRHTPLPKVIVDKNTGKELQLCNACAQSYDAPQNRRNGKKPDIAPTEQELETYLTEAKLFTKGLRANLDVPQVDKLFCPVNKTKLCGCLQRYIKNEMAVSGISCVQYLVKMMTEAEELRKEKAYKQTDKTKPVKRVGLGNGHKKSKRYEEFVITQRRDLKEDMRLCERATQRILMYSNNFLHKNLKTDERACRIERTRGKAALGKLPEIHQLVEMVCCTESCVMMALTHKRLLQKWRDRSKLGQSENRKVLAEMLTPAGANHRNCYHFISYVTGSSKSTIGRVYAMMLKNDGNREPPEHGMKRVWQKTHEKNKLTTSEREKSLNGQDEVGNKEPKVSESRTSQKASKPTNQSNTITLVQTTADTRGQMQVELQKQQLARIQRDLLEKQQQLEQQQANLQMQLMAQQALVQQPDTSTMNQVMTQQVLQQISQQQCQNVQTVLPDQIKPGTSQLCVQGNQSAQTVLSLNYVNGEIQLSISSLNQPTDQNEAITPIILNADGSAEKNVQNTNHLRQEGEIRKPTQVVVDECNAMNNYRNQPTSHVMELSRLTRQTQLPEGSAVSNIQSLVNRNNAYFDSTPLSNLNVPHSGPSEIHETLNQESVILNESDGRVQIMASDQSKETTQAFIDAMNRSNPPEQGTIAPEQTGSNTPRYMIQLVPGAGEITTHQTSQPVANPNLQGQLRLNGLPLQLMDSSGQQYHVITGGVQNQNEGVMESHGQVSSQVPVVNLAIPLSSLSKQQVDSNPSGQVQEALYNVVGTGVNEIKTLTEANGLAGNQFNTQYGSNIQILMNAGNQNQIINTLTHTENGNRQHEIETGKNNEMGPHQFYPQNGILPMPMYLVSNHHTVDETIGGITSNHAQGKHQQNKRNVKFCVQETFRESSSTHESQSIVRDLASLGQEERVVDPDLVLPRPASYSQTPHSCENSLQSRHYSGNPSKSPHSSGNSVSKIDSFKHLTSSFKLKDLAKTVNTLIEFKSNGDRSRQPSGDRSRQPSGDRWRQPSGDRLRQPSGDRLRQSSGDRSRQSSGNRSRQQSGDRSRQPSGNSIFSEYSNLNTISPNLFLNKEKNLFFLQSIDSMSGAFEDMQSPDFSMFNSSPTNVGSSSLTEIALSEAGRIDFDSNFISPALLPHENRHGERGKIKDHSHLDPVVSLNQVPPGVAMATADPCGQRALRHPVLNSILSKPPKYL